MRKKMYFCTEMMSGRYWGRSVSEVIKGPVPSDYCFGRETDPATCIYTATRQYDDPGTIVPGNKTFQENPHRFGFVPIRMKDSNEGDLIQFSSNGNPHHATIQTGRNIWGEPVLSYSRGYTTRKVK